MELQIGNKSDIKIELIDRGSIPRKDVKQCGAGEARRAHNPKVVGSKPTTAIFFQ